MPTAEQQQTKKTFKPRFKVDHAASPMPETRQPERLAPRATSNRNGGRDHLGILGEIKSVHPGEIIGIHRKLLRSPGRSPCLRHQRCGSRGHVPHAAARFPVGGRRSRRPTDRCAARAISGSGVPGYLSMPIGVALTIPSAAATAAVTSWPTFKRPALQSEGTNRRPHFAPWPSRHP